MGELKVVSLLRTKGSATYSWEATWDGPIVEIAQGLLGRSIDVEYISLASPGAADAWVAAQAAARRGEGFLEPGEHSEVKPPPAKVARNPELEAKIREAPEDDELYLVYADWLESQGDPRGQLIGLDHQLATGPARAELKRERLRLMLDYRSHLIPPHDGREIEVTWKRGFFDEVIVNGFEQARAALTHPSAAFVRSLEVRTAISGARLASLVSELGTLPLLGKLDCVFSDGAPPPSLWEQLPALRHVCAYDAELFAAANTEKWEVLELTDEWAEEDVLEALATPKWPRLTTLTINTDGMNADLSSAAAFWEGRTMPALRELCVVGDDPLLDILRQPLIAQLETLRLVDCSLDDEALIWITASPLAHLELLDVRQNWFSDTAMGNLKTLAKRVLFIPQHTDEFEDEDDEEGGYEDDDPFEDSGFSADVVPVYEDDADDEDDDNLTIDRTWERGVVGFDHDE